MKRSSLAICLLGAVCLTGCLCTKRVEKTYHSGTVIDAEGKPGCCQHATHAERNWLGPWPCLPSKAKP
jgi:hypothetical protein